MCLHTIGEMQTASEDIVCYKKLTTGASISLPANIRQGTKCIVEIQGHKNIDAILLRDKRGDIYFAQNERRGYTPSPNAKLYKRKFSWRFDNNVRSVKIKGVEYVTAKLVTYYREADVEVGKTYTSELVQVKNTIETGLHSYEKIPFAIYSIVVKCIIPKGSKYYVGIFGNNVSYASDTLKYVEIISTPE